MSKLLLPPAKHSVYYLSWDTFNDIIPLFALVNRAQKSSLPKSSHFSLLINLVLIKFRVSPLKTLSSLELIMRACPLNDFLSDEERLSSYLNL